MRTIVEILEQQIAAAMSAVTGEENCPAIVKPTADPKFGDYQANGAMGLAKRLKTNLTANGPCPHFDEACKVACR